MEMALKTDLAQSSAARTGVCFASRCFPSFSYPKGFAEPFAD